LNCSKIDMNIEFWIKQGFFHIIDIAGFDHMLFVAATLGFFTLKQWKGVLYKLSLFTLGHSISLIYVALNGPLMPSIWVEVLILLTIFITGLLKTIERQETHKLISYSAILIFGLIHGMGFAKQLISIFPFTENGIGYALFFFNVGIEIGQLLFAVLLLFVNLALVKVKITSNQINIAWGLASVVVSILLLFQILDFT